jgi:hypothetical protein
VARLLRGAEPKGWKMGGEINILNNKADFFSAIFKLLSQNKF